MDARGGEPRPKAHHGAVPSSRWESRTKNSSVRQTSPNTEVSFSFAPGTSVSKGRRFFGASDWQSAYHPGALPRTPDPEPYTNLQVAGGPPEHGRLLLSHSFDADATTARTETFTAASVRKGNVTGGLERSRERLGARLRFLDFNSRPLALQGPQRRYALGIAF